MNVVKKTADQTKTQEVPWGIFCVIWTLPVNPSCVQVAPLVFFNRKMHLAANGLIKGDDAMKKDFDGTSNLNLCHSCLENAPQTFLQLYIIITTWRVLKTHLDEEPYGTLHLLNKTVVADFDQSLWNITMSDLNQSNVLNISMPDLNQSNGTIGSFGANCMSDGGGEQNN